MLLPLVVAEQEELVAALQEQPGAILYLAPLRLLAVAVVRLKEQVDQPAARAAAAVEQVAQDH